MQIIEEDSSSSSSLPSITFNGCHSSFDSTLGSACTFFTSFTPSFHHTECPDEEDMLPPILDTGATHCLLPLRWMTHEQAERCKKLISGLLAEVQCEHYFTTTSFTARLSLDHSYQSDNSSLCLTYVLCGTIPLLSSSLALADFVTSLLRHPSFTTFLSYRLLR